MRKLARMISISLFHFPKLSAAVKDNISHDLAEILVFSLKECLQKKNKKSRLEELVHGWSFVNVIVASYCSGL